MLAGIFMEQGHDHPQHYTQGKIECIEAIAAALSPEQLSGFIKANVIKYLWRCDYKGGQEDIKKAQWYLNWYVNHLEAAKGESNVLPLS